MADMIQRLLVPTDFSELSMKAIDYAARLARNDNVELHLLHVIRLPVDAPESAGKRRAATARMNAELPDASEFRTEPHRVVRHGTPDRVILAYVEKNDIDQVIMGSSGWSGVRHFTLGSVTERVVREAGVPIVVIGPNRKAEIVSPELAASRLFEIYGESFNASKSVGLKQLQSTIAESFKVSDQESQKIVQGLLERDWVRWKSETVEAGQTVSRWEIKSGIEFLEIVDDNPESTLESQAVDLIRRARQLRATDIHVDPTVDASGAKTVDIRLRVDGRLRRYCRLDESRGEHLQNQLKTLAGLDIADPFHPQEGRLSRLQGFEDLEIRITTAQVAGGNAIALRLFDSSKLFLTLDELGFEPEIWETVDQMLRTGEGLVLISGPTGAGKSTTVYSMLDSLASDECNVVSIEDPVEFPVSHVRQMNVDRRHGITMTSGLRTILRMDPDVIFVGEIRDSEAGRTAMKAAGSGKYVMSTLHTRDIVATITTLRDMGVPDRSIAANVTGIVNQRLVRRLCPACKLEVEASDDIRQLFEAHQMEPPDRVFVAKGCDICGGAGYRGRIGVFEAALVRGALADGIAAGESEQALSDALRETGYEGLAHDALRKVARGVTSFEEASHLRWLNWPTESCAPDPSSSSDQVTSSTPEWNRQPGVKTAP